MNPWNLIIDVSLCENCNNCVLAAKDELVANHVPGFSAAMPAAGPGVIRIERHARGQGHHVDVSYVPTMCNHCQDAPCVKAGGGAVVQRTDGIVVFDPEKVNGRKDLLDSCPYGALVWNDEQAVPQNWFFDAHLLDAGWPGPRCVSVCPTRAIEAVQLDDAALLARVSAEGLQVLRPDLGTRPRVFYRHLARVQACFVAGSVFCTDNEGRADCVEGARVVLAQGGQTLAGATTDAYGDFRIDGLTPRSGAYELTVSHPQQGTAVLHFGLGEQSVVLPDLELRP
jgi:Fe-S-cluster-containing dehydrogenase component